MTLEILYRQMLLIRRVEEFIVECFQKKIFRGTTHACIGQEAISVGICSTLTKDDIVFSNHRGHGHMLAKGLSPDKLILELAGKDTGQCAGLGGSQHIIAPEIGFMGSNGITGGSVPIAVGYAMGLKKKGGRNVVVVFLGDGAMNQGVVSEAMNMASIWKLPIVFVCENNQYGMSAPVKEFVAGNPALRAGSYQISNRILNGLDILEIHGFMSDIILRFKNGENIFPYFVQCDTYRLCGHSKSDLELYRTKAEVDVYREKDPLLLYEIGNKEQIIREIEDIIKKLRERLEN